MIRLAICVRCVEVIEQVKHAKSRSPTGSNGTIKYVYGVDIRWARGRPELQCPVHQFNIIAMRLRVRVVTSSVITASADCFTVSRA